MKKTLLVIDYIKGIAETGSCAKYLSENPQVIANTNLLIAQAREKAIPIIHIRLAFDEAYTGLPRHAPPGKFLKDNRKFLLGTPETEFIAAIDVREGDTVLNKKIGDPFRGSGLEEKLAELETEQVILTGVATDNAILAGAYGAISRDLFVTVVADACGAPTKEAHEAALNMIKGRVANEILDTEALLQRGFECHFKRQQSSCDPPR